MKIALTGTPGTGKTTVAEHLKKDHNIIHLNKLVKEKQLYKETDKERDSLIVDLEAIQKELPGQGIFESHFSHQLDVDRIILLRCHPNQLEERLQEKEDFNQKKINENMMAETVDVILLQAMQTGKPINELDTTNRTPSEIAGEIKNIINEKPEPETGVVDWIDQLDQENDIKL
ncbi:adenylate kinase family protein [Methanonatronarchaeum sp. AMET6-2]|uniref:adenylate kinase family protein n=1 Tax=Methanonatronarchaeum sp. AMET6-2 TaxID=2933293 RepID=UPI00121D21BD|nr:AAA family ATPase [Methanonatronarchaeum sp. AMET6-2]RZN63000.1 MAG: adenylate kinase [Methanonatronarchaeia archaeon]UOY09985.1 AAA family ATPase [Methanonatronarchaeum sp. AMET6-2]